MNTLRSGHTLTEQGLKEFGVAERRRDKVVSEANGYELSSKLIMMLGSIHHLGINGSTGGPTAGKTSKTF